MAKGAALNTQSMRVRWCFSERAKRQGAAAALEDPVVEVGPFWGQEYCRGGNKPLEKVMEMAIAKEQAVVYNEDGMG